MIRNVIQLHWLTCPLVILRMVLLIQHCNSFTLIGHSSFFLLLPCRGRQSLSSSSSGHCSYATTCHSATTDNNDKDGEIPTKTPSLSPSLSSSSSSLSHFVDPSGPSPLVLNLGMDSRDKNELVCVRKAVTNDRKEIEFSISRVSCSPNIYLLKNLLTLSECEALISHVKQLNSDDTKVAEVTEGDAMNIRSNCRVAWVQNENSKTSCDHATALPRELGRVAGNVLLTDEAKSKGWCEALQVVHYDGQGGKFDLHHDGLGRSLTIIYYLNGVGNTWFPFAQGLGLQKEESCDNNMQCLIEAQLNSRNDAVRLVEELSLEPGRSGVLAAGKNSLIWESLRDSNNNTDDENDCNSNRENQHVIQVAAGDAIAFFNYKTQLNPETFKEELVRDMRSVHAGLPTHPREGEKWIANHWMHSEHHYKGWERDG